ncbi:hypothetical protein [Clostridium estertheticum]|uniref:hypothetical protein n=1 Tax=Clostridium estertheticum TaxID=238834 RepID=UPI001CF2C1F5|nr:hypothetical protein [Clostridium estertheticum]MCB2361040.1 hypothetical protein [Clostridium estertheticum]
MENLMESLSMRLIGKGENIFIKSQKLYSYDSIINGCMVRGSSGKVEKMYAVGTNTWRGFHKLNKKGSGSKEVFVPYFNNKREYIISELKSINTVEQLDRFEDKITEELRGILMKYIKNNMLDSYNKVRKPVDLYIEHIVSMAEEFTETERKKLVPLLFLPLDSQIFASEYIFSLKELYSFGLKRGSTFQDVNSRNIYKDIQNSLVQKLMKINGDFHRIYFDFFWNERYKKSGANLFETNIN